MQRSEGKGLISPGGKEYSDAARVRRPQLRIHRAEPLAAQGACADLARPARPAATGVARRPGAAYLRGMKPVPLKARDQLIFGATMAATALTWLVAPDARLPLHVTGAPAALGFLAFGFGFLCNALYLWSKPKARGS